MSDPAQPTGQSTAPAVQPAAKAAPKAADASRARTEATLDDPVAEDAPLSATSCRADVCQLGDKMTEWAGIPNFECPRCGYATVSEDTARARNPKHFNSERVANAG